MHTYRGHTIHANIRVRGIHVRRGPLHWGRCSGAVALGPLQWGWCSGAGAVGLTPAVTWVATPVAQNRCTLLTLPGDLISADWYGCTEKIGEETSI